MGRIPLRPSLIKGALILSDVGKKCDLSINWIVECELWV